MGFLFQSTRNFLCELGSSGKIGPLLRDLGSKSVMVLSDKGVHSAGLLDNGLKSLEDAGVQVTLWTDTQPDPPSDLVHEALDVARSNGVDGVVGFGGGSSMDIAKLVAFLGDPGCEQQLDDIYGIGMCKGSRLPLLQVPTTAGTGSEVTHLSIITTGANEKKGIGSPQLLPDWAVLDGELLLSVPSHVSAATGIDAMVHAIEAYTTAGGKKNNMSDMLAKEALQLLGGDLRRVCGAGASDASARSNTLLGSMYAGMAFANAPVAAVHALAYPVGSHFHVPHGHSNSLMLPHVLRFNAEDDRARRQYAELLPFTFPELSASTESARCDAFIEGMQALCSDLLPGQNRLRDVGISETDLELLATEAMKQSRLLPNNPREITLDDARSLYQQAY